MMICILFGNIRQYKAKCTKKDATEEIKKLWLSWDGREIKTDGRDKEKLRGFL